MPPRTISDDFTEYSDNRVTQPSVGRVIKYPRIEYAKNAMGTSMRAGGVGMQKGGRVMRTTGEKMVQTGATLSRTGVGAIAGVPLMAAGGVVGAAGVANQIAGKTASESGRLLRNKQRRQGKASLLSAAKTAGGIKNKLKITRTSVFILSWATPLWFTFQLPLAIISLIFLGVAGSIPAASEFLKVVQIVMNQNAAVWLANKVLGSGVTGYVDPALISEQITNGMLWVLLFATGFIGLGTLFAMSLMYTFSGAKCLFGEASHLKVSAFIFAVFGSLMPVFNLFPWFILWALAVWRYPK